MRKARKSFNLRDEFLVFLIFLLSRLPSLGRDIFNTDVWKWKTRTYGFSNGIFNLDFAQTLQKYHPGVVLMWIGTAAVKIYNLFYDLFYKVAPADDSVTTVFDLHFVQKLLIISVIGISLSFAFYVLRQLFDRRYAFIVLFLLVLEPFYVALTRVVHLEGLMSTFMLVSFLWFYYFLEDPKKSIRFVVSAIFGGLALLTKTSAVFLILFMGFAAVIWYWKSSKSFSKALRISLGIYWRWLIVLLLVVVALWPALWVIPLEVFDTLYKGIFSIGVEGGHLQLYFGKLVNDPGISFYPMVLFLKSSFYLIIGLVGYFLLARKKFSVKVKRFVTFVFLFCGLYMLQVTLPSKKLDRYLLPSILGFTLIAGFFYQWVLDWLKSRGLSLYLGGILLLLPGVLCLARIHPDYFSYFNPMFGGLRAGVLVIEPKWIIGQHEIVDYLRRLKEEQGFEDFVAGENVDNVRESILDKKLVVGFQEKYYTQIWPFLDEIGVRGVIKDMTPHAKKADYFVYPSWDDESDIEDRVKLEHVDDIVVRGVPLWYVYKVI